MAGDIQMSIFSEMTSAKHYFGHPHACENYAEPHVPPDDASSPQVSGVDDALTVRKMIFNDVEVLVGESYQHQQVDHVGNKPN